MEENRFSAKNCITSQLESIVSDLEHMTSGNFMHHRASAKMLAKCALQEVDEVISEQREKDIEKACKAYKQNLLEVVGIVNAYGDDSLGDSLIDVENCVKEFRERLLQDDEH